jgi:protein arginine kinase activator
MDLCEECKKRKQELSFVEVKDGKRITRHLCSKCAEKLAIALPEESTGKSSRTGSEKGKGALKCPNCRLTYAEFRRTAKLGCETCFEAFGETLNSLLRDLHASAQYTGKPYEPDDRRTGTVKKIHDLKRDMEQAVTDENFEEAARIRDEIKTLEEELNEF